MTLRSYLDPNEFPIKDALSWGEEPLWPRYCECGSRLNLDGSCGPCRLDAEIDAMFGPPSDLVPEPNATPPW